jgi:hypothetical protein
MMVNYDCLWYVDHAPTFLTHSQTPIDILHIKDESFVKAADILNGFLPCHQTSPEHPIHFAHSKMVEIFHQVGGIPR